MSDAGPTARTAFGGALHTGASQAVRAGLLIASTIIVARLLSPDDFGVIAMAAPVLAFVLLFQDLGLSAATIQAKTVSQRQSSALFWVNLAASVSISLLMLAIAPLVGWFYGDVRAGHVTAASAAVVLLIGSALQHMALLTREMRFGSLARIVIAGAVANFVATVGFAWLLGSYWALFLGNLAGAAVQAAATWIIQPWRPDLRVRGSGARRMLRFGGAVAGFDLLNFFSRNADNILIGRVWGSVPLGLYERSYSLMMAPLQMVNAPLSRVMLPVLSRLRDEPVRYRIAFASSLRALLLATMPLAALAVATSEELILLLLGEAWREASPIFFWLAIGCLYQPLGHAMGWLFVSTGRGRALMQWGILSSATTMLAFLAGLPWGAAAVAMAYVLVGLVRLPVLLAWAPRTTPVDAASLLPVIIPPSAAAAVTIAALTWADDRLEPVPLVAAGLVLAYLLGLAALLATRGGREFLATVARLAKSRGSGDGGQSP